MIFRFIVVGRTKLKHILIDVLLHLLVESICVIMLKDCFREQQSYFWSLKKIANLVLADITTTTINKFLFLLLWAELNILQHILKFETYGYTIGSCILCICFVINHLNYEAITYFKHYKKLVWITLSLSLMFMWLIIKKLRAVSSQGTSTRQS